MNNNIFLEVNKEVRIAQKAQRPVIALESTIISHGMPYPQNVETAFEIEELVRSQGVVPATIGIINGKLKAGLTTEEINFLGKEGENIHKASRRDIPFLLSTRQSGATTVAATMIIAQMANIPIFATGGIGGVHRGVASTLDISADLQELAHTSVAVVSAGVKSILDIPKTLEYLETHGVPVIGYRCKQFPAFYSRESQVNVDFKLQTATDIAHFLHTKWQIPLPGGVIIANPIPPAEAMNYADIQEAIEQAISEAEKQQITGKAITPFLLSRIVALTGGESLKANIALVKNNALLAAEVVKALVKLKK